MFHTLIENYTVFMMNATGSNEMLVSFITVGLMGTLAAFVRYVPMFIFSQCKRHLTTSFTINNTSFENELTVARMLSFLSTMISSDSSRTTSFNPLPYYMSDERRKSHSYLGTGYGFHWFIFNKKLFWMEKDKLDSAGSERQKEEYTFRCFGRSHEPFKKFVTIFAEEPKQEGVRIYTMEGGEWRRGKIVSPRNINSVAMSKDKKNEVLDNIKHFKNNKEWFSRASLPYKLTYILYGKPGSGKTSFIKAIASEFEMNLCVLNISAMTDGLLQKAITELPDNSILAIEDFDSSSATKDRGIVADKRVTTVSNKLNEDVVTPNKKSVSSEEDMFSMLTLSGILNALDGIIPLENSIIFLTTNSIETVDPALYRKGRVDYLMEMNELTADDILEFSEEMFPDYDFSKYRFNPSMGCSLNEALLFSRGEPERYLSSLSSNNVCS